MQKIVISVLFLVLAFPFFTKGQLVSDSPIEATTTNYASTQENDPVFCFPEGTPMIIRYETNVEDAVFSWYQHDEADHSWDNQLSTAGHEFTANEIGGYRLVVEDAQADTTIADERFWVYNTQKLRNADVEIVRDDCFSVELSASIETVPLIFFDPQSDEPGRVGYGISYKWTPDSVTNRSDDGSSVEFNAPYEDLTYVVTVTDRFGNDIEASVDYDAIAVKADFETDIQKDSIEHERHDEARGSAPIEIQFTDESLGNVSAREWTFGNAGRAVPKDPLFVFSQAGTDSVTLKVVNRESECSDISDPFLVNVWESELDVPNVFTPNGDGINDEFRVAYRSIKKFEMVVFNRWGRKVYESDDPKKGWKGKVGGKTGAPGVYFYNIKGVGFNEDEVHKKEGAIHLIRDK